jgi:GTPase SAR1 family protein
MTTDQIGILTSVLSVLSAALLSALVTWIFSVRKMPASHRVAIIGFPQTGKTTLITSLFDYMFRHGARGRSIVPRGDETIRRINENLEQLELGRPIRPTSDQDVFAFRAEVDPPDDVFGRRYKLEIGDFPGEDTVVFTEQYGAWLHDTPYFQWAVSADAFVFVADGSSVVEGADAQYIARQKSVLRAAWQRLREHHLDGGANLRQKTLLLVFTKADLLLNVQLAEQRGRVVEVPRVVEAQSENVILGPIEDVRSKFGDLISYFELESSRFSVVFTSAFLIVNGERLGIREIARRILPRLTLVDLLPGGLRAESRLRRRPRR